VRDIVVFTLFVVVLPTCFLKPWFGLMAFTWMAYNRTQDLTWGFAKSLPIAEVIAIAMILGWMAWEYRPLWFKHARLAAMVALLAMVGISLFANGFNFDIGGKRYIELVKIVFIALLTAALMVTRVRLRAFCLVVALGLGFYGVKNAIWYLLGGGTIVGPGGMLKDNNDFALAMVMNLPFLWYCSGDVADMRFGLQLKWFLRFTFFMTLLTIMSTGSRGGFLAATVVLLAMAFKTRWKIPALVGLLLMGLLGYALAPASYKARLATITTAQDQSAQGRLISWQVALHMIKAHPVVGIGFNNMYWQYQTYLAGVKLPFGAEKIPSRVAHNSYLQIWAESGSIAFILFLYLLLGTISSMRKLARSVRNSADDWVTRYANTVEVTLIGYMAGAMFLNRAHFDLMYQLVAVSAAMPVVVIAERERQAALKRRRLGPKLEHEVRVRHTDPFVRLPTA
jgi:probable O-glycosylation ligase (exosortase A-associated)